MPLFKLNQAALLCEADEFALLNELAQARSRTDRLFELVPRSLFYERPIRERHRLAFYLGHLEAFDVNLLLRDSAGQPLHNSVKNSGARREQMRKLHGLFAFGIDPVDGIFPSDAAQDWPALTEIQRYVQDARQQLGRHLMDAAGRTINAVPMATLLHVAIEHRLMHAETLAYLMNRLPLSKPARLVAACHREFSDDDMALIPAGMTMLGTRSHDYSYAWDNEYDAHQVKLAEFAIDRHMVTNGQFLRFIEDGGYTHRRCWTNDDWQWRESQQLFHPASWQLLEGEWYLSSLYDVIPFQGDWPVYVSHAEATAYAKWCGKELPTEAQWQRAGYAAEDASERAYPWGDQAPGNQHGNFNFKQWDPLPVDAHPAGASAFGVMNMVGNGWEWTASVFAPFAGFKPAAFYPGYSADFFDGQHFVLKGGSAHTATRLLRRSFRNWFQPHYPYVCAGFRCVSN